MCQTIYSQHLLDYKQWVLRQLWNRGEGGMAEAVVVIQTSRWVGPPLYPVPRLSLRGEGWGFPWLLSLENRRNKAPKKILSCFISCLLVVFTWQPEILVTSLQFLKLIEVPDLPLPPKGKKCEILNLELGKGVTIGWKDVRCPKFPSGRTFSGDYWYWKSLHHFKAGGVNIIINFTI